VTVSDDLVWLLHQLQTAPSAKERLRFLARAYRTLRELDAADRLRVAHEIGVEGAEELVEQLARRGGASPSILLDALERIRDAGPEGLQRTVRRLVTSQGRSELAEAIVAEGGEWLAGGAPGDGEGNGEAPPVERDDEQVPGRGAVPADERRIVPAPLDGGGTVAFDDEAQSGADAASDQVRPGGPSAQGPPGETPPTSATPVRPDDTRQALAPDVPEKVTAPGRERTRDRKESPEGADGEAYRGLWKAVEGTDRSVLHRLRALREALRQAPPPQPEKLRRIVESFPDGWARRRVVEALLRAGMPVDLDAALALIATLGNSVQRAWALSTLAAMRSLSPSDEERVLDSAGSQHFRRRLERRLRDARG
jgi:hypothetical protein